jgi:hypothetical protein
MRHDGLDARLVGGGRLLMEVVQVDVLGHFEVALGQRG